jgi:phosphomannomutase
MHSTIRELIQNTSVGFGTSGVRGLVSDLEGKVCFAYAQAFMQLVSKGVATSKSVLIGHDLRPSSPSMAASCAQAFQQGGFSVIYAGALPTPALALFAKQHSMPAIIVTGSHIPFDRNGVKFYTTEGEITKSDEKVIDGSAVTLLDNIDNTITCPLDLRPRDAYIQRYVDFFGQQALSGLRVGLYEHSSVARDILQQILILLGAEVVSLGRTDAFVPIDTEAVRPEDIVQGRAWAAQHKVDAILSTDGDADRPFMSDENGVWIRGDVIGVLCAQFLAAKTVVTPVSSNTIAERSEFFSEVVRTRIGSPYVIAAMQDVLKKSAQGVVGFEANGGFLLGSDVLRDGKTLTALPTRDAVLPMLSLLATSKNLGKPLSCIINTLPARYTASDRLQNFSMHRSAEILNLLKQNSHLAAAIMAPQSGAIYDSDVLDGLRLTFENGDIVHLRASGNAPELRCYAEASSVEAAELLCAECLARVQLDRVQQANFSNQSS